ncbi:hypothetical protein, partial [Paraburkholderia bengalensis]|uniref:hypothetical protein n=1 Tax=Paraburkholderia bengalensis TaxID=2747562 RepID=UPI0030150F4C
KRLVALKVGHVALVSVGSAVVEQQAIFSGDDLRRDRGCGAHEARDVGDLARKRYALEIEDRTLSSRAH